MTVRILFQRYLAGTRGKIILVFLILAASLALRLLLFNISGYKIDEGSFAAWFNTAAEGGLYGFYDSTWCDYPPFNIYVFWIFGKLAHAISSWDITFFIRLGPNLFDLATAALIFYFLRKRFSFKVSLAVMTVYAFNPATIFNLAVWGQMDSIYTLFMVATLITLLNSKYELSGALFSLAILTKPQTVVLLPIIAYVILRNGGWRRALSSGAVFWVVVLLVILPFRWENPVTFLVDRYSGYGVYPYNSINAYNFWALLSFWKSDTTTFLGLSYQVWGIIAMGLFAVFVLWLLHRKYGPEAAIFAVFLLMFGFFMLMTRMHERYLFPVFALLALGFFPRSLPLLYAGLTATCLANMAYILPILNRYPDANSFVPDGDWSFYVLVPANAILLIYSLWSFYRMQRPGTGVSNGTIQSLPIDA